MSKKKAAEVAEAAAALAAAPSDLGAWLGLSAALAAAGERARAAESFRALGEAASDLGQVALAVACARWLADQKQKKEAEALTRRIAETHGRGSKRIDHAARPLPPPRRPNSGAAPASATTLKAAVAAANDAVAAATSAAAERAPASLPATPLVRALDPDEVRELIGVMKLTRQPAGHVVVDVGQQARALFWIARGAVAVTRGEHALGDLRSGAFFGEIALVGGTTRTARVATTEETWLLEIPAAAVEELAGRAPKLAKVLAEYARVRLLANVIRTSELFRRLEENERREMLARFSSRLIGAGEQLITRGQPNDTLFVVASGCAEVRDADGACVAELVPGDGVGEMSLMSGKPAVADVVAVEPVVVLGLSRADFDEVAVEHPGLLAEVYKLKIEREHAGIDSVIHDADDLIV